MEGDLHSLSLLDTLIDNDDLKYFAGVSTVLMTTIQEVKDRISQIEFVLCSQLFSNIELRYKALHKRLTSESRNVSEDDWRKKESSFLCQMEELQHQAQEQVQLAFAALEQEKAKSTKYEQLLCLHETEKKLLLDKLKTLEKDGDVAELQEKLRLKSEEEVKGKYLEEKLLHDIHLKDRELLAEKKKRKEVSTEYEKLKHSFKELKSRYEVLRRTDEKRNLPRHRRSQQSSADSNEVVRLAPESNELKIDVDDKETSLLQNSNSHSDIRPHSASCSPCLEKCPNKEKVETSAGQKHQVSDWAEMQPHRKPGCTDPQNNSLNMPMEIPKLHLSEVLKEIQDIPDPASKAIGHDGSSDRPQDVNADPPLQKQHHSIPLRENKGFEHVEPLGKKAERENDAGLKRSRPGSSVVKPQPSTKPKQVQSTDPVEPGSNWRFNQAQPKSRIMPEQRWIPSHETQMQPKSRTEVKPKRRSWHEIQVQPKSGIDSGPKWRPWDEIQAQPKSGIESEAKWSSLHETQMQRKDSGPKRRPWDKIQAQPKSGIESEATWIPLHETQMQRKDSGSKWRPWDEIQAQPKSGIDSEAKWCPLYETQMQRKDSGPKWRPWDETQAQPKSGIESEAKWSPLHETQMQRKDSGPKWRPWDEIQARPKSGIESEAKFSSLHETQMQRKNSGWRPWDETQEQPKSGIESEAKWSPLHETQMQRKSRIESEAHWRPWNENQVQSQSRIVSEAKWRLGHGNQDANADTLPQKQHFSIPVPENKGFKCVKPVRKKGEKETGAGLKRYRPVSGSPPKPGSCPRKPGSSTSSKRVRFTDPIEPDFSWRSNDAQPKSRIESETKWRPWPA